MAPRLDLTLDTRDAEALAPFWKLALGYEDEPPPAPFASRETLRGYSWLTICPREIGDRPRGPAMVRGSGAFVGLSIVRRLLLDADDRALA